MNNVLRCIYLFTDLIYFIFFTLISLICYICSEIKCRPKFFYIGRRYNIDYLWFMLSPLRWFILVPIHTPPLWVSATSTFSLFLFLPSFLFLFLYIRLSSYSIHFFCTSITSFFVPLISVLSFFLAYSLTYIYMYACAHTNIRNRTYYPTTCYIPASNDSMALPHPFAIE